jgi:CRP-like cAMP-binding protein
VTYAPGTVSPVDDTIGPLTGNSFVDSLRADTGARLRSMLRPTILTKGQVLAERGQNDPNVWFPVHSTISDVMRLADGVAAEVGIAGHEGLSALSVAFGSLTTINTKIVQTGGAAFCLGAEYFAELLQIDPHLRDRLLAYLQYAYIATMQLAACNGHHLLSQRYARSLLMASDRLGSNDLKLTHEDSAQILNVRRAGVTEAAAAMSKSGLIRYRHGSLTVLDRERLESSSCECYAAVNAELFRCMGYEARKSLSVIVAA